MGYEIKVEASFSAAHKLRGYAGRCENLHGHNWKVEVSVCSPKLDKIGMVMDFKELKSALKKVINVFDHCYLNDISYFKKVNPTSENIAKFIFDKIKTKKLSPERITVWESETSSASYCE